MADFDDFIDVLEDELTDLAQSHLDEVKDAAVEDGEQFLDDAEDDLKRWTRLLEKGEISDADFRSLVKGKKDLAKMEALKQAGLAAVEVDKFQDALVDRIVGTARTVFL